MPILLGCSEYGHVWLKVKRWSWRHPIKGVVVWSCGYCDQWRPDKGGYPDE